MNSFQEVLDSFGWKRCLNFKKYSSVGRTFHFKDEDFEGIYWYYETDQFIIDIHDFFIKKERIVNSFPDMRPFMSFISTYIKTANGECFNPYQTLTSNTMFVMNVDRSNMRFLLHSNFPYVSVGINFKDQMIEDYISCYLNLNSVSISDVFFETRELITKPMEKLANSILSCTMNSPAAGIFFEAKAKEWLSITLNEYFKKASLKPISKSDETAIENVTNYINDHYALDIPQELLEKISMMSGTKLKSVFKQKYHMSITEYSQRKRMNIAETLLATTELEIKDVAKSVGYSSHSRFTTLFKKYKGFYPRDVKKLKSSNKKCICK
ncbi:MAG: AraC family transcriptional regulator [Lachnospiraceae bacterium]|nr:AraC family transcriptional regulator [Lachnospiraceae bacterium]